MIWKRLSINGFNFAIELWSWTPLASIFFPPPDSIDLAIVSVHLLNASSCIYMTFFAYNDLRHKLDTDRSGLIREKII